jgi:PHP family Zn ribbon phosphoesterase
MNRTISALDRFALISNSDCHSPSRLGREANIFATGFDFHCLHDALKKNTRETFRGTIEFFPEEGKYHLDGHRNCGICLEPAETRRVNGRCPVCGRPVTVGVLNRVMELADRKCPRFPQESPETFSLVPLPELLGEICAVGPASKKVAHFYSRLIARFGSEFSLLLLASLEEVRGESLFLAEAIRRVREGQVVRHGGYDGQFGSIRLFREEERVELAAGDSLFSSQGAPQGRKQRIFSSGCSL